MFLKKLELQGFKSFPDYTVIKFEKGLTAVVGPNGSGKSNITDAVRWVLGEQSVKSLRGGKMEDVIFGGTAARKPMNYSEVTITFDNSDKYLDYDFPEIQVTRRLYRSGESEYSINKVNCRLKDITTLFLDTGLGKDGYSIVGQGRVDDILSPKSEDRRRVIEEASGIVKYKVRKDEAERKLSNTEQNLLRIDDVLNELNERKGPLEEQAGKARDYHKAYEELKELEISLLVHKITEAEEQIGGSASVKSQLEKEIEEQQDAYLQLRKEHQTELTESENLEDAIEDNRQFLSDLTEQEHDLITEKKVSTERKNQTEAKIREGEAANEDAEKQKLEFAEQIKEYNVKADKLLVEANDAKSKAEAVAEEQKELYKTYEESELSRKSLNSAVDKKTQELFDIRSKVSESKTRIEGMNSRIRELSEERQNAAGNLEALEGELEAKDRNRIDMKQKKGEVNADIEKRNKKLEELRGKQVELNQFFDEHNKKLLSDEARLRTLKDLERRKEGYQESVKKLVAEAESDRSIKNRIVGILGDLITTDTKYQTAIEIALGNSIHNIVTKTEEDASRLIGVLKDKHLGRVTFLPIENIRPRDLEQTLQDKAMGEDGYIGIASELVKCDKDLEDIVSNLLGRIIVSDDLDSARKIASRIKYNAKVITLSGDSVNPGGSLTGGSVKKSGVGILGRAKEIDSLTASIASLEEKLANSEEQRQEVDDGIGTLKRELEMLGEQLKFYTLEEVKAENEYANTEEKLKTAREDSASFDENISSLSKDKIRLEEDIEELVRIESEIEDELAEYKDSIEEGDAKAKEFNDKLNELREKETEFVTLTDRKIAERNGVLNLADHIKGQIKQTDAAIEAKKAEMEETRALIAQIDKEIQAFDKQIEEITVQEKVYEEKIAELSGKREAVNAKISSFGDRLTKASDAINDLQNKLNNLVAKYDRYFTEIDIDKNKLWEDYEVTYDNVRETAKPVEKPGEQAKQITSLKNKIKQIGPVNLGAIDEFKELSERLEFMNAQRQDIENAKKDLEKLIADLIAEMETQFNEHFKIINDNFKQVFVDLFGGGTAEIQLEGEDVLSCNIEIKAQPPGKTLKTLSLLSGGERCLTAIALLFAILELKPSPFVILDEVEAALDDANIVRFTDFVKRYSKKTQFMLVTHRKGTMEACDQIYGVTMAERGISKILSMELD